MTTPFLPTPADTQAARLQLEQLRGPSHTLDSAASPRLAELLEDLLGQLAAGRAVQVLSLEPEISTQQAAELLGVSRPYLVKLVEAGELPHRKVGPRRRLHLQDVLAYRERLEQTRRDALQDLADDLQDLGLD
ncbi:helix-turn-helix domain-containing protein [Deinococcus arenicola]|uniref:Helix-turn-helix domain-containing protein n=1 Tax=Deinococcus arenicola TaxID=2994950 RepID=A0ABU4DVU7_9DEIO|nr:helix-turn-helix domain-containing protein [Deinococcus sp. ZS9-10]MDV6376576.1 helix-turn-helix domain-containing protein [Deinococcus sp. ZS9-10]